MEHDKNRSAALDPETLALINSATASAVQEAIKGAMAMLAPILQQTALTPEKMNELKKPYIDPHVAAREKRESQMTRDQEDEMRKAETWRRANCPHKDKNDKDSICVVHNQPDHMPRGVCMLCNDWIHPRMWVIDAPDPVTGKSSAHVVPAHKDFGRVLRIEATS